MLLTFGWTRAFHSCYCDGQVDIQRIKIKIRLPTTFLYLFGRCSVRHDFLLLRYSKELLLRSFFLLYYFVDTTVDMDFCNEIFGKLLYVLIQHSLFDYSQFKHYQICWHNKLLDSDGYRAFIFDCRVL